MKFLWIAFFFPVLLHAQVEKSGIAFGDRFLLGVHYGYAEDYVSNRNNLYERTHFVGFRAGISINRFLYAGIQTRLIRASNFETPAQNFYMAGLFARAYLLHPARPKYINRLGIYLETGFMLGNFAFENRNFIEYYYERPGSWYLPNVLGVEFRVLKTLTLEGGLHLYYNNGSNWNEQGIAYMSVGANLHL